MSALDSVLIIAALIGGAIWLGLLTPWVLLAVAFMAASGYCAERAMHTPRPTCLIESADDKGVAAP